MARSASESLNPPMTEEEQYKALDRIFKYIDENEGATFASVARHFKKWNGGGFYDPSFRILTTDWGTRTVLAYLDD